MPTTAIPARRKRVDTKTRYEGIFARHQLSCALGIGRKTCTCKPSYYGTVWDNEIRRNRRTKRVALVETAKKLRADLLREVREGIATDRPAELRFEKAHEEFIEDVKEGVALNKHGKPYKPKAKSDLDTSLKRLPAAIRKKKVDDVTQGDFQRAVDGFRREGLSSSRIASIINAARSLYTWAEAREKSKANRNPAAGVKLPANDSKERDRVATPGELGFLLAQLEPQDAVPWALAAYATARSQEIRALEWPEVDFENDVLLLAEDDEARKSEAARRIVPMVGPLRTRLYNEWLRQGRPAKGRVCPPRRESKSGKVSLDQLQKRVVERWESFGLTPIRLQECRHTAATWLDHAGVAPKVASVFMGHKAPGRHLFPGAAPITLRRYTHVLPGELERAAERLGEFLQAREGEEEGSFEVVADGESTAVPAQGR